MTAVTREGLASSGMALKRESDSISTSAALLSSGSPNVVMGESKLQCKAGLDAHLALNRCAL